MAGVLMRLIGEDPLLVKYAHAAVRNWRGALVGEMRCVALTGGEN